MKRTAKTATAKSLAKTENISMREAEQQLDANAYLQEQQQWDMTASTAGTYTSKYSLHAAATGQSEPSPE